MPARSRRHAALGQAFKEARLKSGLTQAQAAQKASLPPTYISDIERGVRNPSYEALRQLADALDVRLSDVFKRAEK